MGSDYEVAQVLEVAQTAAMNGAILLEELRQLPPEQLLIRYKEEDGDSPSTIIGTKIAELINETIRKRFKHHRIIDEEMGEDGPLNSPWTWYIDPDDGSSNTEHGLPGIVVGLSAERDGEVLVAAIGDPADSSVLSGRKGHGAWLRSYAAQPGTETRQQVSERTVYYERFFLDDGYGCQWNREPKGRFEKFMRDSRKALGPGCMYMRSYGSMITHWKLLVCGRADVVLADAVGGPWDTNPGRLLVPEAGGKICNIHNELPTTNDHVVLGTSGVFHEKIFNKFSKYYQKYPGFRGPKTSTAPRA